MNHYSFEKLVKEIENMSWDQMITFCNEKCIIFEKASSKTEEGRERVRLANDIKGVLFWLGNGVKPYSLENGKFQMLKTLCLNLINKSQLKKEALEAFQ